MDASLFQGNLVNSSRILYTPSVFAKTNLIHLQEAGTLQAQKPHTSKRENLASYLFFLVLDGSGTLEYDGRSFPLHRGDCVFLDCRRPYSHRTSEDLWTLKWANFYGPNMNGIYEKYTERGGAPAFRTKRPDVYAALLDRLFDIASSGEYIRDMKIYETLASLLTCLMEESWNPAGSPHSASRRRNLQNVKEYLDQNYREKITLDSLAEMFYINKFYLTRIFREQFGVSVSSYLSQVRITHAKQLLRFTDLPVEKIAHECGMADANYFTRMFKKVEGVTPGEYRRRW